MLKPSFVVNGAHKYTNFPLTFSVQLVRPPLSRDLLVTVFTACALYYWRSGNRAYVRQLACVSVLRGSRRRMLSGGKCRIRMHTCQMHGEQIELNPMLEIGRMYYKNEQSAFVNKLVANNRRHQRRTRQKKDARVWLLFPIAEMHTFDRVWFFFFCGLDLAFFLGISTTLPGLSSPPHSTSLNAFGWLARARHPVDGFGSRSSRMQMWLNTLAAFNGNYGEIEVNDLCKFRASYLVWQ